MPAKCHRRFEPKAYSRKATKVVKKAFVRGIPGANIKEIQFLLYKFSCLINDFPEIKELDINPYAVDEKGGVVLDAKVILDDK